MNNFWDERYGTDVYIYGVQPNLFFQAYISDRSAGKVLLPAEGEGRNAVCAARCGWQVEAFDQSKEGQSKALKLANEHQLNINYVVSGFESVEYPPAEFDAIGLIYAHIPQEIKAASFRRLLPFLKTGGHVVFEGFSKEQTAFQQNNPSAGGPRDVGMLFSEEELADIFQELKIIRLETCVTSLSEGTGHQGESSIIRMIAQKV